MSRLTLEEQKEELKKLIDEQADASLLNEVRELLNPKSDPILREKLIARALRSEEDIKHGRVYTPEQALERINRLFEK